MGVDGLVSAIYYFPATAKQDEKWCMIQRVFIFAFECCRNNFQNLLTPLQKSNGAPLKGQLPRFRDSNLWERKTPGGGTPYIPMIGMIVVFFRGCNRRFSNF